MFRKRDIWLLLVIVIGIGMSWLILHVADNGSRNTVVIATSEGISRYPLSQDRTIELVTGQGYNKVVIENGHVHMGAADCPDQRCVRQGMLPGWTSTIICLPHQVVISLAGEDIDAISQ